MRTSQIVSFPAPTKGAQLILMSIWQLAIHYLLVSNMAALSSLFISLFLSISLCVSLTPHLSSKTVKLTIQDSNSTYRCLLIKRLN